MSPYLLLGFLFAGILNVVISKRRVSKYLGKRGLWSSVKASILGVPLPLCSCGVIPTGISFHKNGASKGATNSFLISTPQTGLDSILMTFSMMNIYWAVFRPIVAFITGVIGGFATDKLIVEDPITSTTSETEEDSGSKKPLLLRIFNYAFIDFSLIQFNDVQIDFGAHNGYLSILVQYGIIFSIIFFSVFIYFLNKIYKSKIEAFGENILQTKFLFFLISYTLVNGMFENTLIGINFFQSNLFWITLAYLLFVLYHKDESNSISD